MMPDPTERTSADRYAQLPPHVRDFIEDLREEEVQTLKDGIKLVNALSTVSRLLRWLVLGLIGGIFLLVQLLEAGPKLKDWLFK